MSSILKVQLLGRRAGLMVGLCVIVAISSCSGPRESLPSGYRGSVLTGVKLRLNGALADGAPVFHISPKIVPDATLETILELGEAACDVTAPALKCPARDGAVVEFTLTATLNIGKVIEVDGEPSKTIKQNSRQNRSQKFSLGLPALEPGVHCLAVALSEDAQSVVRAQLPDHSVFAAWQINVGSSSYNHCMSEEVGAVDTSSSVGGLSDCSLSILSVAASGVELRRQVVAMQPLFAAVSTCGSPTTALLIRDGRPQLADSLFPPFTVTPVSEDDGELQVVKLGPLPPGAWRLATISSPKATGSGPDTGISEPVIVVE